MSLSHPELPFTVEQPLLAAVLAHNPTIARALGAVLPTTSVVRAWPDLTAALAEEDRLARLMEGFLGNKSERLVLACVLMKADYAGQADSLMPRVFSTWGGMDPCNAAMVLDMLEGVDEAEAAPDAPEA